MPSRLRATQGYAKSLFQKKEKLKSCFLICCSYPSLLFLSLYSRAYCQHYYRAYHILLDSTGSNGLIKKGVMEEERKKQV